MTTKWDYYVEQDAEMRAEHQARMPDQGERLHVKRISRQKHPKVLLLMRLDESGIWRLWQDVQLIGFAA
jgi:hypothetical protein